MCCACVEHLLRIFLGITDKLLYKREEEDNLYVTKIATQTSRLVLEVFLRSSFDITRNNEVSKQGRGGMYYY